uniref:inter-alpha-trypsin inhibitor heavy chain H3-like n=1 Tax=Pristiophorus japonicus TaxID=55135 RepID=UPI00398EACDF
MEKFKVSVNVAAGKKVTFELTYEELLKRTLGKYEMIISVKPMQLVNHFQIDVYIFEPKGIAFLNVHGTFLTKDLDQTVVKNRTETKAHISFKPTLEQQRRCPDCSETLLDGDFIIQYDVNRDLSGGDIQIVNGYFVHHFAPTNLPRLPKNVIFVIDRSFSMRGLKFKQTKLALLRILGDMNLKDHFTIISFDSTIEKWRDSLVQATPENVLQAKRYIFHLRLGAETNINDSLLLAVSLLDTAHKQKQLPERSVSMIILLTDGDPNVGEKDPVKIQINVKSAIQERYSLYCLGFGFDVDYSFLEKMALDNGGVARRIYDDSDSALQLQASNNLSVESKVNMSEAESVLEHQQYIFGDFTERLWAYLTIQQLLKQRVSAGAEEKKKLTNRALELSLKYSFVTPLTSMVVTKPEENRMDGILVADKPMEKEWVLCDAIESNTNEDKEIYETFFGPAKLQAVPNGGYSRTSQDSRTSQGFRASQGSRASPGYIRTTSIATPGAGSYAEYLYSRAYHPVTSVDGDPHFIIQMQKQYDAICFNIDGKPDSIVNLVTDLYTGIKINGQLIGDKKTENNQKLNTYFGTFGLENSKIGLKIAVTTEVITVYYSEDKTIIPWSTTATLTCESFSVSVMKEKNLTVTMGDDATFVIVLHRVWKNHPQHRDFLGFYTLDSHKLSNMTHGLLGQFYHDVDAEVYNIQPGSDPEKPDATMVVKGHKLIVTRGWQKDYRLDPKRGTNIPCWFIHNNGKGFIDGTPTDYIVSSLFDST